MFFYFREFSSLVKFVDLVISVHWSSYAKFFSDVLSIQSFESKVVMTENAL